MQNRSEKIKLITGRLMRGPALTAAEAERAAGNPARIMRAMIERAVAAGLTYRDSEDAQVPIDIAEARKLVDGWNKAIEDESEQRIDQYGDAMASFIREMADAAAAAFGEPGE